MKTALTVASGVLLAIATLVVYFLFLSPQQTIGGPSY